MCVREIDSKLAYRLRLIDRAVLLKKIADKYAQNERAQHNRNYDKNVQFKSPFAAPNGIFVERPPLSASATDKISDKGYSKLMLLFTGPYRVISFGHM